MNKGAGTVSRGFLWAASGTALQLAAQMLALVALARLLSPFEFGVVSVATLVTQLTLVFSEFGVAPYVVQAADLDRTFIGASFRLSCLFGVLLGLVVWLLSPILETALHVPGLTPVLRIYCIVFLVKGWSAVQEALCQRDLDFRFLARADGWSFGIGYTVVSITCAWLGMSYWSIVAGHLVQALLKAAFVSYRHPRLSLMPWSTIEMRRILRFGVGQTLSRLGSYLGSQADSFVVASTLGVAPIGYYGRANQLVTMPAFYIGQVFDNVVFPAVARVQDNRSRVASAYELAIAGVSAISVPMAVGGYLLADLLVTVLLGPGWDPVGMVVKILAVAIPFRLLHKVSDPTARALGATYSRAWRQWLFAGLVLFGALFLQNYGLKGVAWAVVGAAALDAILMVSLCCDLSHLRKARVVQALIPAIRIGAVFWVVAFGIKTICANEGAGPVAVLVIAGLGMFGIVSALLRYAPALLLGSWGRDMLAVMVQDVSGAVRAPIGGLGQSGPTSKHDERN